MTIGLAKLAIMLLLAGAVALSGLLALNHRGRLPGCGKGSGCKAIAESRWSQFLGMPVAWVGGVIYLGTLIVWFWRSAGAIAETLAWIIILTGFWFALLQLFVMKRMCIFCMLIHLLGGIGAIIILTLTRNSPVNHLYVPATAIGCVSLLAASQVLIKPAKYILQFSNTEISSSQTAAAIPVIPEREPVQMISNPINSALAPGRMVSVLSGKLNIQSNDWPLLGSVSATFVLVFLFDYTCSGCRHLRRLLEDCRHRYGNRLAILEIPVPMSPSCNPTIKPREASHPYACAFARLGLSMWVSRPERYPEYARWVFDRDDEPPVLGLARQEASRLVGTDLFDPNIPDPELDAKLKQGLAIYESLPKQNIPALLLPHGVLNGHVADLKQLLEILGSQLGPPEYTDV